MVKERGRIFKVGSHSWDYFEAGLIFVVFANSGIASILTLIHAYQLHQREQGFLPRHGGCYPWGKDLLVVGIIANYAAVAADTFSSELGILSKSQPRLITSWNLRKVPPGTNGGVTLGGLAAGLLGSIVIVTASILFTPFCPPAMTGMGWSFEDRRRFTLGLALWGALGSVLDSFLGGCLQASVIDTRSGKIVEGEGGRKVLVSKAGPSSMHYKKRADVKAALLHGDGKAAIPKTNDSHIEDDLDKKMGGMDKYDPKKKSRTSSFGDEKPSRVVESGSLGLLDNNEVNFVMALTMSLGAMGIASLVWGVPMQTIFTF